MASKMTDIGSLARGDSRQTTQLAADSRDSQEEVSVAASPICVVRKSKMCGDGEG